TNITTFNNSTATNHTPTFTNPAHVTTPTNKSVVSGLNTSKLQVNPHITTVNPHSTTSVGGNQFQTLHKSVGGPFQGHTVNGNQLLLHTNQGQLQTLNAHQYNQAFLGNQAIHLAPVGYQPSYLMHA